MKKIFDDLKKQLEDGEKRWSDIDQIYSKLKDYLEQKDENYSDKDALRDIVILVTMLVDNFRPISNAGNQLKDLENEINNVFGSFGVKK